MTINYYTIGMAGHIDHGKTTLTKALSGVDTDTLKEEKSRKITIEPGFAPFPLTDSIHTSIVDVPGHEKLIRQMIAGVAGIDLVLLVIAGDEGVMPQTREHFEILSFLEIQNGIIVVTKSDLVDDDMKYLIEDDISELIKDSVFQSFNIHFVDSVSMNGIDDLKKAIAAHLANTNTRTSSGPFRLPIDHIFTVKGQGTVIRGTVYEGEVHEGDELDIQPAGEKVKVRKLQVHKQNVQSAMAGQRAAINLSGGSKNDLRRGHVLLTPGVFSVTETVDLVLNTSKEWTSKLKQRTQIKFYTGTAEVMGKLILFDRNELEHTPDQIFCQVRLNEPIVTKRGDRFIIRRPSPEETIGGGAVIDPNGTTYKFGQDTVRMLQEKFEGTPEERVLHTLQKNGSLTLEELVKLTDIEENSLNKIMQELVDQHSIVCLQGYYIDKVTIERSETEIIQKLKAFHDDYPLRQGIPLAEVVQSLKGGLHQKVRRTLIDKLIQTSSIKITDQFLHLPAFESHYPTKWEKRMSQVVKNLEEKKLEPDDLFSIYQEQQLPEDLFSDFKYFLINQDKALVLSDDVLIGKNSFDSAVELLKSKKEQSFTVQEAKSVLHTSRKFLIPILECMDAKGYTERDANLRKWV
ncbi:selenocysteine-specific translation elongation factor [Fictibacillus phosphorivorans]|uniref:selenocysteine-specific translation elongation factor n=1 Tax=Fictibacillus phosphorivorans TaxID=1221500 RepID=UPI0020418EE7|nr:selenocysteine-specific translation elongation factor [Fictibacillus phosphorivorans]MCM3717044.1 selenocysteine-specific translation elongation factor [Fictibacillus phosphorivorans]MCM3774731.1 selenocysteine-specific translation elongation factor [Fictibacillus phosphorivorans]